MNKNAIQKFAIWARNELIAQVSQRAYQYGIDESGFGDASADTLNGRLLTAEEKSQRQELIKQIKEKGYQQVMEEVAYTWFNRFIALRFMEVNNYLPSHIRVFSDASGAFKPEILNDVLHLDLPGLDSGKVAEYIESNDTDALYRYLLLTQCNALNSALPVMFERMGGYTEMLLPNNILRQDSVLGHMVSDIPEEDWQDAVQIIGWLYQYYNTELKDDTFAQLKKNVKITKERIPAATQLFTPDWIVRYMVENSLGRLWLEGHPNAELHDGWKYYLDEAKQEPEVEAQLAKLREEYKTIKPEEIKVIDPCMGSGHILVYAFDVLMQIYTSAGWDQREAAQSILKNNLFGLDIDDRAAQLAYFAVMMKARQYDRRLLTRRIQPNIYSIRESNGIQAMTIEYFHKNDPKLKADIESIVTEMRDAKEYGSILNITPVDFAGLYARFDEIRNDINMMQMSALDELLPLVKCAEVLAQKYDVVVTNPPYMGASGMGAKLSDYVKKSFPDSKADMFAVFIERCGQMAKKNGYQAMITQPSFLFLTSFERLREKTVTTSSIENLLHMGRGIFGIDFGSIAFVIKKRHLASYKGVYLRLHERTFQYIEPKDIAQLYIRAKENHSYRYSFVDYTTDDGIVEQPVTPNSKQIYYEASQDNFSKIPGSPVAYWVGGSMLHCFDEGVALSTLATPRTGIMTGDNARFLRLWWEVANSATKLNAQDAEDAISSAAKWFPYNKGGEFRRWYGNEDYLINWENGGVEVFTNAKKEKRNAQDYPEEFKFKKAISWSLVTSGKPAFRLKKSNLSDIAGPALFTSDRLFHWILAFCNSIIAYKMLNMVNPTINYQGGNVGQLPILKADMYVNTVDKLTQWCVDNAKQDWDSYETSWDFKRNPLV